MPTGRSLGLASGAWNSHPQNSSNPVGRLMPLPRATIAALILPPYEEVQPALPPSPALLIETADPLWDWLFFLDKTEGTWQISLLVTLSKESGAYSQLLDDPIRWP